MDAPAVAKVLPIAAGALWSGVAAGAADPHDLGGLFGFGVERLRVEAGLGHERVRQRDQPGDVGFARAFGGAYRVTGLVEAVGANNRAGWERAGGDPRRAWAEAGNGPVDEQCP